MRTEAEALRAQLVTERAGIEAGIKQMEAAAENYRVNLHRIDGALAALDKLLADPPETTIEQLLDEAGANDEPPQTVDECGADYEPGRPLTPDEALTIEEVAAKWS